MCTWKDTLGILGLIISALCANKMYFSADDSACLWFWIFRVVINNVKNLYHAKNSQFTANRWPLILVHGAELSFTQCGCPGLAAIPYILNVLTSECSNIFPVEMTVQNRFVPQAPPIRKPVTLGGRCSITNIIYSTLQLACKEIIYLFTSFCGPRRCPVKTKKEFNDSRWWANWLQIIVLWPPSFTFSFSAHR